jgi:hypothetical protein
MLYSSLRTFCFARWLGQGTLSRRWAVDAGTCDALFGLQAYKGLCLPNAFDDTDFSVEKVRERLGTGQIDPKKYVETSGRYRNMLCFGQMGEPVGDRFDLRRVHLQSDERGSVIPQLLRVYKGDNTNRPLREQVGQAAPNGAFAHSKVAGHLRMRCPTIFLENLNNLSV